MSNPIVSANVRSREALVTICGKCEGDGKALRRVLKAACKARGRAKAIRFVMSSCLDICPKRRVAIAVAVRGDPGVRYFAIEERDVAIGDVLALID